MVLGLIPSSHEGETAKEDAPDADGDQDAAESDEDKTEEETTATAGTNAFAALETLYQQVKRAILVRRAQAMIATPSEKRFKEMISNRELANCPVTVQDITNAHAIFGPDLPGVRGKTVRRKPSRVEPQYVAIPDDFHKLHRFVTLTADVMFVNG